MALKERKNASIKDLFLLVFLNPLIFLSTWFWVWKGNIKFKELVV
jgi:hypothetical protein